MHACSCSVFTATVIMTIDTSSSLSLGIVAMSVHSGTGGFAVGKAVSAAF